MTTDQNANALSRTCATRLLAPIRQIVIVQFAVQLQLELAQSWCDRGAGPNYGLRSLDLTPPKHV